MHRGAFFEIDQVFLFMVVGSGFARRPRMEDHLCGLGRVRGVRPGDRSTITVLRPPNLKALDTVYVGPVPEGRHMFVFQVFSTAVDLVTLLAQVIYISDG